MIKKTPRFFKRRDYKSKDKKNPDKIFIKLGSFKPSTSDYTTNINVKQKINGKWISLIFPLKPRRYVTSVLWELWKKNVKSKYFKRGKIICLCTWKEGKTSHWRLFDDLFYF